MLDAPDADTFRIVAAASRLREKHFGRTVKVNYLVSLKTGLCPENCTYCSQRLGTAAEILRYTWLKPEEAVRQAGLGIAGGASRVCMVASGTGPTDRDVDRVAGMVGDLKAQHPDVEVCALNATADPSGDANTRSVGAGRGPIAGDDAPFTGSIACAKPIPIDVPIR